MHDGKRRQRVSIIVQACIAVMSVSASVTGLLGCRYCTAGRDVRTTGLPRGGRNRRPRPADRRRACVECEGPAIGMSSRVGMSASFMYVLLLNARLQAVSQN